MPVYLLATSFACSQGWQTAPTSVLAPQESLELLESVQESWMVTLSGTDRVVVPASCWTPSISPSHPPTAVVTSQVRRKGYTVRHAEDHTQLDYNKEPTRGSCSVSLHQATKKVLPKSRLWTSVRQRAAGKRRLYTSEHSKQPSNTTERLKHFVHTQLRRASPDV